MRILGRIYVAKEGINAQISVPEEMKDSFRNYLYSIPFLDQVRLNIAVDDNGLPPFTSSPSSSDSNNFVI